jgi:predicted RNA-binding protein YlxR (DUF448 family)/ribosomal protein L30E
MSAAKKLDMDEHDERAPGVRSESAHDQERERRDIVSGEVMPEHRLVRFVADPDGNIVPDVAAKLPGRGAWVSTTAISEAVEKKLFARALKAPVKADADLAGRTEKALVARMLGDLGLARRGGNLVLGFDNVARMLDSPRPPALLVEASDGARDGKRKLYNAAHARELKPVVMECLTSAELGLALGRENVIHAAVHPGGLAERLILDAQRLKALRGGHETPRPKKSES